MSEADEKVALFIRDAGTMIEDANARATRYRRWAWVWFLVAAAEWIQVHG